jgi:hypothetical protein
MKKQTTEEMRDSFFQFSARHNLSLILDFHTEFRDYLEERTVAIDRALTTATTRQECVALQCQRHNYAEVFDEQLRWTTFLLMYAHAEEWFFHLWRTYAPTCQLETRVGSIRRFRPALSHLLGNDMPNGGNWQLLCDAEKIRHCLLHSNGRVSLMKKPEEIELIVERHNQMLGITNDRLRIALPFLDRFKDAIEAVIASASAGSDTTRRQGQLNGV